MKSEFYFSVVRGFIGAPKFTDSAEIYNTTGAVFKCNIEGETCEQFQLGNPKAPGRHQQFLGLTSDILPNEKYIVSISIELKNSCIYVYGHIISLI